MHIERVSSEIAEKQCRENRTVIDVKINGYQYGVAFHHKPDRTYVQFLLCPMRHVLKKYGLSEDIFLPYLENLKVNETCFFFLDKNIERDIMDTLFNSKLDSKIRRAKQLLEPSPFCL